MDFLLPPLTSFILTLVSIPLTIKVARKFNLMDNPKIRPHPAHTQNRIVPRAGGLACFIGIFFTILFFLPLQKPILGILFSLSLLLLIGLADDRYQSLSPYFRLLGQLLVALIVVGSGIGVEFITNPLGGILHLDQQLIFTKLFGGDFTVRLADILGVVWIVWVMNMINWSKGVDGQMPGIVVIATLILGFLSLKLYLQGDTVQQLAAKLSFLTAGSAAAFLLFNWYPAKIFPGFSGSTIFGFLIAVLAILSGAKLATAGLVLLVPATDFVYTFLRRIFQGKSPVWGDRGHLHHRLLDLGFSHRQIALFYLIGSAILGAAALSLDSRGKMFAAVLLGTTLIGAIIWLNFFGALSNQQDPDSG